MRALGNLVDSAGEFDLILFIETLNNQVYKNQNAKETKPRIVKEYNVGDKVRVRLPRKMFEKRSLPEWSKEIYTVQSKTKFKYKVNNSKDVQNSADYCDPVNSPAQASLRFHRP